MFPHLNPEFLSALSLQLGQWMGEYRVPGVSVGLMTPEGTRTLSFGVTSLENPLPVTPDTLFQVGSIGKVLTATLVMALVESRHLKLDTPLRTYLPDLNLSDEAVAAQLTLRHLLTHTGGFRGDVFQDTGNGDDALSRVVTTLALEPQVTPLGAVWSYNSAGFYLAGRVVEVVTGQTFEAAMHERVLRPLGMDHASYFPAEVMTRRFVVGHVLQGGQLVTARPWNVPRSAHPAGGLSCSVNDLLRFAQFHLTGTAQAAPISRATALDMQRPSVPITTSEDMGLSWFIQRAAAPLTILHHGGTTSGQRATLWLIPEVQAAFAVQTNASGGGTLKTALQTWLLEHWLNTPLKKRQVFTPDPASYAQYVGYYRIPGAPGGDGFTLRLDGDQLLCTEEERDPEAEKIFMRGDPPPPAPLVFSAPDQASIRVGSLRGTSFSFLRDESGAVRYVRSSNRVIPKVH